MSVDGGMDQENRSRGDERWPDSGFVSVVRTVAVYCGEEWRTAPKCLSWVPLRWSCRLLRWGRLQGEQIWET